MTRAFPFHANARLSGLHARSEELVQLTREYDRGRVPWNIVEDQLRRETVELIALQEKLGCQYVSDGSLGWKDQLRPLFYCVSGLAETTRYSRWYDTNTFYQKPIVVAPVNFKSFDLSSFLKADLLPKNSNWLVTIPGPWTLTELSENKYYASGSELLEDYARALREIILRLVRSGVKHVQLSEPSLVYWPYRDSNPSDYELGTGIDAIRSLVEGVDAEFSVHTFFGDATPIISQLWSLPVSLVGVDLYESDWTKLPNYQGEAGLILGIVDSEESLIESPEWLVETARLIRKRVGTRKVELAPNTDLKFVPRRIADKKLESLGTAASALEDA